MLSRFFSQTLKKVSIVFTDHFSSESLLVVSVVFLIQTALDKSCLSYVCC